MEQWKRRIFWPSHRITYCIEHRLKRKKEKFLTVPSHGRKMQEETEKKNRATRLLYAGFCH